MVAISLAARVFDRGSEMPPIARIPVVDPDAPGHVLGWVMYDAFEELVEVEGVHIPAEFHLRLTGGTEQPSLHITFQVHDGRPFCVAVNLGAKPQGRQVLPVDFETLRNKLNHYSEVASTTAMLHVRRESGAANAVALSRVGPPTARRAYRAAQKRSRTKVTDELLSEVAELYRDSGPDSAWGAIADRYGVSKSTAGRYVVLARKAGYLPPTKPGKKQA
jgi:hypothetical protein